MEVPRCPLCGGHSRRPYAEFPELAWARCDCGLIYKQRAPDSPASPGGAGAFGETGYGQRYRARNWRRVGKSLRQIRDALEYVDPQALRSRARVLDIGCSLGYTLEAGRELGFEAVGVDVSEAAVAHCRGLGYECHVAGLEHLPFPDGDFAVIVMKHVLEHTIEPRRALREARRALHPGGALFIAVPHAGYGKAARDPERSRFYRPDTHGGAEHWVYYTPDTLSRLLREEGFAVRRVHPLLFHRRNMGAHSIAEALLWPFDSVWERLRSTLALRKEFWLVATPAARA
jgi:SAM-dependent methyltransferase